MKLLHVVPTYVPAWRYGGPIRSVHGLCKALARRGHEVSVATTNVDGEGISDVPLGRPVALDGVHVHYFRSGFPRRIYRSPDMGAYLANAVAQQDIVHVHSVFLWPTSAAASAARAKNIPYVVSPRGMLVPDLIRRRSAFAKQAWIAIFERRNIEAASAVHTTSALESVELRKLGMRLPQIVEIANGVDIEESGGGAEERASPADAPPDGYALFLGRINWKKGLERLVDALVREPGVRLVVAGSDEDGYRAHLERMATYAGVSARMRFVGFVDGGAKATLLRRACCVVLPSDSENFGNALLEAMAAGTPVVATPAVGLAELVDRENCGFIVPPEPHRIGEAMRRLATDPALRARLGANGRRIARERFSWDDIAARFETHYLALAERRSGAA